MSISAKYVVLDVDGLEASIVLSPLLNHIDVVPKGIKVISAGFCRFIDDEVEVWGSSNSLGVDSIPSDAYLISRDLKR